MYQFARKNYLPLLILISSIVFLITSFIYVRFSSPPSGDEPHYLIISQTLLKYHSLDVMSDYTNGYYHAFYPGRIDPHLSYGPTGQNRTIMNIHLFNYRLTDLFPSLFVANQTGLFLLWSFICVGLTCVLLFSRGVKSEPNRQRIA